MFPPTSLLRLSLSVAIIGPFYVDCDGAKLLTSLGIHDFATISVLLRPLLSSEYPKYLRYLEEGNSERFLPLGRVVVGDVDFLAISGTLQIRAVLPDKNARSFGVFTLPGIVQIRRVFRQ